MVPSTRAEVAGKALSKRHLMQRMMILFVHHVCFDIIIPCILLCALTKGSLTELDSISGTYYKVN